MHLNRGQEVALQQSSLIHFNMKSIITHWSSRWASLEVLRLEMENSRKTTESPLSREPHGSSGISAWAEIKCHGTINIVFQIKLFETICFSCSKELHLHQNEQRRESLLGTHPILPYNICFFPLENNCRTKVYIWITHI